ncbi:MAG: hypothetical protein WDZ77_00380 [Candidatus Pacearchaeota archaeon]
MVKQMRRLVNKLITAVSENKFIEGKVLPPVVNERGGLDYFFETSDGENIKISANRKYKSTIKSFDKQDYSGRALILNPAERKLYFNEDFEESLDKEAVGF